MLRLFLLLLFSGFFAQSKGQKPKKIGMLEIDFQNTYASHKLQGKVKSWVRYNLERKEDKIDTIWGETQYYNEHGLLVEQEQPTSIVRYSYNSNNQPITMDRDGHTNYSLIHVHYIYNEKGNIITLLKKQYAYKNSEIDRRMREDILSCEEASLDTIRFFYNKHNQITKITQVSYNTDGIIQRQSKTRYSYSKKSIKRRFVETKDYEKRKMILYRRFNKQYHAILSKRRSNYDDFGTWRWKYNTKNQVIYSYGKDKSGITKIFYTLDEKGNTQKEKTYSTNPEEDKKTEDIYHRNEQGKILQQQRFVDGTLDKTWSYEYTPNTEIGLGVYKKEYDEAGNLIKYYSWENNEWQLSYFNIITYYP